VKVEQNAVDKEGQETPFQYLAKKLVELIIEKKILTAKEINDQIELFDKLEEDPSGPTLVVHAWTDPNLKNNY